MSIPIALVAGMGRFAAKTIGKPVIMGRKTFESVIAISGRPLVDRPNIVLSRDPAYQHEGEAKFPNFESELTKVCRHGIREDQGLEYEWVDYMHRVASRDVERTR